MRISDWSSDVCSSDLISLPWKCKRGSSRWTRRHHAIALQRRARVPLQTLLFPSANPLGAWTSGARSTDALSLGRLHDAAPRNAHFACALPPALRGLPSAWRPARAPRPKHMSGSPGTPAPLFLPPCHPPPPLPSPAPPRQTPPP